MQKDHICPADKCGLFDCGYSPEDSELGSVGGSVLGSVDGSVGSVDGSVGSVDGSVGSVDGSVGSVGSVDGSVGSFGSTMCAISRSRRSYLERAIHFK